MCHTRVSFLIPGWLAALDTQLCRVAIKLVLEETVAWRPLRCLRSTPLTLNILNTEHYENLTLKTENNAETEHRTL